MRVVDLLLHLLRCFLLDALRVVFVRFIFAKEKCLILLLHLGSFLDTFGALFCSSTSFLIILVLVEVEAKAGIINLFTKAFIQWVDLSP